MSSSSSSEEEEEVDSEEEMEIAELTELAAMSTSIDRILLSLKRLTKSASPGGELFESQKLLHKSLQGKSKPRSKPKRTKLDDEAESEEEEEEEEKEEVE